ncbi:MAG: cell division protein ZapE, partial [Sandarakinorhabdus sp.]|nr:cell division protein ZapE [Sandarakinorhabdus sp.]
MTGVRAAYDALVAGGELREDVAQAVVVDRLQRLANALEAPVVKPGFFARLTG